MLTNSLRQPTRGLDPSRPALLLEVATLLPILIRLTNRSVTAMPRFPH
jgi:hypothetical protein